MRCKSSSFRMNTEEILISHSEVDTYLLCKQRHYYAFGDNDGQGLEPKELSKPLYRGTTGHLAVELYWKAIQEGSSITDAAAVGLKSVEQAAMEPKADIAVLGSLRGEILPTYFEVIAAEQIKAGWRPYEVEVTHRLNIPDGKYSLTYPFKPDLIMTSPTGERVVIDHKFIYDFYWQPNITVMSQIPTYIGALRMMGMRVDYGAYNMLRTRPVGKLTLAQRYMFTEFTPSKKAVTSALKSQIRHMREIADYKTRPNEEWKDDVDTRRVMNNMICKSCSFKELCAIEIEGGSGRLTRKADFVPNTYGYSPEEA